MKLKKKPLTPKEIRSLEARYRTLTSRLGSFGSLSQGSVMHTPPGAWRWTRKVNGKTVSLGLSSVKAERMKQAIANDRTLGKIIAELREISQKLILNSPETVRDPRGSNHPKPSLT